MEPVRVRLFAAAREAAGVAHAEVAARDVGELLDALVASFPDLAPVLTYCSVLVEGERTADRATVLGRDSVVDVLPPYAGG